MRRLVIQKRVRRIDRPQGQRQPHRPIASRGSGLRGRPAVDVSRGINDHADPVGQGRQTAGQGREPLPHRFAARRESKIHGRRGQPA